MNPLADLVDKHPTTTGFLGLLSGFSAHFLQALHTAAGVATDIGALLGTTASGLAVILLVDRWRYRRSVYRKQLQRGSPQLDPDDQLP